MEACLQFYLNLSPQEGVERVKPIIQSIKDVDGILYTLCHNNSFSEVRELVGWRDAYEAIIQEAIP